MGAAVGWERGTGRVHWDPTAQGETEISQENKGGLKMAASGLGRMILETRDWGLRVGEGTDGGTRLQGRRIAGETETGSGTGKEYPGSGPLGEGLMFSEHVGMG